MFFEPIICWQYSRIDKCTLKFGHKMQQVFRMVVSNVINTVRDWGESPLQNLRIERKIHNTDNSFHDIINISKVALTIAVVKNLDIVSGA